MLVLDTDLLSIIQQQEGDAFERLSAKLEVACAIESVCVTIVSFEEQMRGWLTFIASARTVELQLRAYSRLHEMLRDYCAREVLGFDNSAALQFNRLRKSKIRIGTMDLRIASIAISQRAKLLSRNLSDFSKVPGLDVVDWTQH